MLGRPRVVADPVHVMSSTDRSLMASIGAKFWIAVTGILLSLFVVAHLAGNLLVYGGRAATNDYAEMLKSLGPWLWLARAGLLAALVLHVGLGLRLAARNRGARPQAYVKSDRDRATWASRSMALTGALLLVFILLHLAHFTLGFIEPSAFALRETGIRGGEVFERHDVYAMLVSGFRSPIYVVSCLAGMVILGLHLFHGLQSLFQTLGFRHASYVKPLVFTCRALAILLALGFASIPIAVLLGLTGNEVNS